MPMPSSYVRCFTKKARGTGGGGGGGGGGGSGTGVNKHRELLTSVRRYYSNAFTDRAKQDAMNLFLGACAVVSLSRCATATGGGARACAPASRQHSTL